MYAQLVNSYCWSMLNNKNQLTTLIQQIIANGKSLSFDDMPTVYATLRNRQKSVIMTKLVESINNGDISIVYCEEGSIRIPLYLPFVIVSTGSMSTCKGLVFLNNCEGTKLEDEYDCNVAKLKVALESCYMAMRMHLMSNTTKLQSSQIVRPAVGIYSHIIVECLNRKFSIKLDQDVFNTVMYVVSKYFVKTVMGCDVNEDIMDSYCIMGCNNPNVPLLKQTLADFKDEDFVNIQTVITALANHPRLKSRLGKLTVSGFIESYINMYDSPMMLALENFPYFVFNILSVNARTYINRYQLLENTVGDDGKKLYGALVTTIC